MSLATLQHEPLDDSPAIELPVEPQLRGQTSLSESVAILVFLSIAQRAIGLVRGVLVCAWLNAELLGEWDLANRFLFYAAPLLVLGIPGSFGRYLEYYRQRGALKSVIRRSTIVCAALMSVAWLVIVTNASFFAGIVFGSTSHAHLMQLTATCLMSVVAFNYMTELFTALRMTRLNAILQFFTSIGFAVLCIGLLIGWRNDAASLIVAYSGSCLILVVCGMWYLRRTWQEFPSDRIVLSHGEFWGKMLPFAFWIWIANNLTNGFENVGRYMIVHYAGAENREALAIIGNLNSAQLIPSLMLTLASMIGSTLLPYLSKEWEQQNRDRVSAMINLGVKMMTLFCLAGSVVAICFDSFLFNTLFKGKYPHAHEVFHLTLMCSTFSSTVVIAQMYLWCAEKARFSCVALGIGLVVNIGLNALLLPSYGLQGCLISAAIATVCVMGIVYAFGRHWGLQLKRRTIAVTMLPALLFFGPWPSIVVLTLVAIETLVHGQLLFTEVEREQLARVAGGMVSKVRGLVGR